MSRHKNGPGDKLTAPETETLQLVSNGFSDKQIAELLGITHFGVTDRVRSILLKLQASTRTEAACRAIREGIIK